MVQVPFLNVLSRYRSNRGRYLIMFTGIVEFRSTADNVISKVPGVHHAGAAIIDAKSVYKNRGSKDRAQAAREIWWKILNKEISPMDLPAL
jgi:hypothetical protein